MGREIHERRDYSEKTAELIDKEVSRLISEGMKTATDIIHRFRPKLETIATLLLEKETLEREEFEAIFAEPTANRAAA